MFHLKLLKNVWGTPLCKYEKMDLVKGPTPTCISKPQLPNYNILSFLHHALANDFGVRIKWWGGSKCGDSLNCKYMSTGRREFRAPPRVQWDIMFNSKRQRTRWTRDEGVWGVSRRYASLIYREQAYRVPVRHIPPIRIIVHENRLFW
jgi:hypothetical protein